MLGLSLGLSSARRGGVDALLASMGLSNATDLLAIDFRSETMRIKDSATPANAYAGSPASKLTYSGAAKYRQNGAGILVSATGILPEYSATGENIGYLSEAQSTNKLLYSQDFTTTWALDNSGGSLPVVTPAYAAAPDGTMTATRLQMDKTGGTYSLIQQIAAGTGAHVLSVWMKNNLLGTANVGLRGEGTGINCAVTPTWQRFQFSWTAVTNLACQILLHDSIAGNDETCDISIWGAQCEAGAYASSYTPTTTAQVTRSVDSLTLSGSSFPVPSTGGMMIADWTPALGASTAGITLSKSSSPTTDYMDIRSSVNLAGYVTAASVTQYSVAGSDLRGTRNKIAMRWKENSARMAVNGATVGSHDAAVTLPTGLDILSFALANTSSFVYRGHIRSLVIVPGTGFTDADIISASTL